MDVVPLSLIVGAMITILTAAVGLRLVVCNPLYGCSTKRRRNHHADSLPEENGPRPAGASAG